MNCNVKYKNRRKVWWKPGEVTHEPKKLDPLTWKIFCQDNIHIQPGKSIQVALSFGVEMAEGATLVSLVQGFQRLKCSIQNEVVIENTSDITITIQNNSTEAVAILPGQDLCLLRYI